MSCEYQQHIKYQEGRIRYLELELKAARNEVNLLKNGNTSNTIRDKNNANNVWLKPKNSNSRARRFSADDVSHIRVSNKFNILEADQQNQGLLKHEDMKIDHL
jgi:protein tyrosine/serine phosphatase